jgi:hypothetical protein
MQNFELNAVTDMEGVNIGCVEIILIVKNEGFYAITWCLQVKCAGYIRLNVILWNRAEKYLIGQGILEIKIKIIGLITLFKVFENIN